MPPDKFRCLDVQVGCGPLNSGSGTLGFSWVMILQFTQMYSDAHFKCQKLLASLISQKKHPLPRCDSAWSPIIHVSPRNLFHEKGITLDQYYVCLDVMEKFCKTLGADGEKGKHLNKEAWNMSIVLELFLFNEGGIGSKVTKIGIYDMIEIRFWNFDTFKVKSISRKVGTWSGLLLKLWHSQKHANHPRHFVWHVALMGDIRIFGDLQF